MALIIRITSSISSLFIFLFHRHEIYNTIPFPKKEVNQAFIRLLNYMLGDNVRLEDIYFNQTIQVYNQKDILHTQDVRFLFTLLNYLILITGLVFIAYFIFFKIKKYKNINFYLFVSYKKVLFYFSLCIFFIFIFVFLDFNLFWKIFHEVLFTNDLYLLDPRESFLIRMLPLNLFNDFVLIILIFNLLAYFIIYKFYQFKIKKEIYD